jgi:hypothetical protein
MRAKDLETQLGRMEAIVYGEIVLGIAAFIVALVVRELRKKYKVQIEYLRKDYSGTSKGRKYVHYALKIGTEHFGFTIDERGSVSFSRDFNTIEVKRGLTKLADLLAALDEFLRRNIETLGVA